MASNTTNRGYNIWDVRLGDQDEKLINVLDGLCGINNSNMMKIDDDIKLLLDRIVFINDKSEIPETGIINTIYIVKSDILDDENNILMKHGFYLWNDEQYKYIDNFNASEISYDNTISGLESLITQDAIDELVELNKNNIKSCGNYEIEKTYKKNDMFKYNDNIYITETEFTSTQTPDFSKIHFISEKKYDHFIMEIDANINSNPSVENGGIKYSGGCEGFDQQDWVDWLGYKPCIMCGQGGIESYLDPNDYSKDINGNTVDITSASTTNNLPRNVMVRFQRIGLQTHKIEDGKWVIRCTNDPCDHRYLYSSFMNGNRSFEAMFIGVYNGSVSDGKLHSVSNADIVSKGQTLKSYRTLAQANGISYNILDIKKLTFLKYLYMLQNSTINGKLMSWFDLNNLQTGFFNTIGLNKNDISTPCGKFLGIETNGFTEIIEGAYVDENYRLKIANNDLYTNDGAGYIDSGKIYTLGTGYMGKNVSFDVDCGIIPNSTNGTDTTLFNCQTYLVNPSTFMNANMRNIFNYEFKFNATFNFNGTNARLCYLYV